MYMDKKARKPNRLPNYDYALEGSYFITMCTHNRACLFQLESGTGKGVCPVSNQIIHKWLAEIPKKFPNAEIEKYVVMPDHLHMIIDIKERHTGRSLPDIIRFFKTMTTNDYIRKVKGGFLPPFDQIILQKSYYDHVIRNQQDHDEIWEYIENNPLKWELYHSENR